MDHYQFLFENLSPDQTGIFIAHLTEAGVEGFEESENGDLKAFIAIEKFDQNKFDYFISKYAVSYSKSTIKDVNWNEEWERNFSPVIVFHPETNLPFACVRANFHAKNPAIPYDILVTPKMSFGTGHHATTYLMIQQMSLLDFRDKTVIDFGTGTGVLAILAEKLGAAKLTAIDNDEWSISNAAENLAVNDCVRTNLLPAGGLMPGLRANFILANINLNIILSNLETIKGTLLPDGQVLISGILVSDKATMITALEKAGFNIKHCIAKDNWLMILAGIL